MIKRFVDFAGALMLLALTAPLQILCAVAIATETGFPTLYRSTRIGRWGQPFVLLKFRTMVEDADDAVHRDYIRRALSETDPALEITMGEPGKIADDPRVTRVGRFLRRTSIDELPQLINVLRGEMSLVGPRPDVPYAVDHYQPGHKGRFVVLPGITGLWQISGRSRVSVLRMLELDLEYVNNWSLGLDLRILLKTIPAVLSRRGSGL